jgi:hypothetical protein
MGMQHSVFIFNFTFNGSQFFTHMHRFCFALQYTSVGGYRFDKIYFDLNCRTAIASAYNGQTI